LKIPQFLIGVAPSDYCPSSSGLHRRPAVQPRLPICPQLAPPADFRLCLPTQPPTLIVRQLLWPALQSISSLRLPPTFLPSLPANLRLASPINLPAPPSNRPATVATCRSSSLPSNQPPACAFRQSSSSAFLLTSSSRLLPTFQLCLQT